LLGIPVLIHIVLALTEACDLEQRGGVFVMGEECYEIVLGDLVGPFILYGECKVEERKLQSTSATYQGICHLDVDAVIGIFVSLV
jgi:hypothetical protein